MAHGSKKWITRYDGKIKRSNDRTKKDKYGDLPTWTEMDNRGRWNRKSREFVTDNKNFCPQCKHVQKHIYEIQAENKAAEDREREVWRRTFGEAVDQWEAYNRSHYHFVNGELVPIIPKPKTPEPPRFYTWLYNTGRNCVSMHHQFDTRSYLCYKHERMYEVKWGDEYRHDMWGKWHTGGITWMRRQEYRDYRNDIKTIMQKAKYNEEYYDDIFDKKHGWLD